MEKSLRDFAGDFNYLGTTMARASGAGAEPGGTEEDPKDRAERLAIDAPNPSLAQVRQAVNEYCILPMGSREVHLHGPYEDGFGKSLLLYGPPGVGKTLLVHAIAAECGMLLFDLSPKTTDGLYKGKKETVKMVQKVFKVAKALAPSVVYIDEMEKVLNTNKKLVKQWKAAGMYPYEDKPDRIKAPLLACMKELEKDHADMLAAYETGDKEMMEEADQMNNRVMLICESARPYDLNEKDTGGAKGSLCGQDKKGFRLIEKLLYVPPPDYSSQLMITELVLAKACGAALPSIPKALVQTLAHIGNIYTPKFIEKAVRMTITPRRLQRLARKPLSVHEFVPALASFDPVYKESDDDPTQNRIELFKKWSYMASLNLFPPEVDEDDAAAEKPKKK
jgi:SpoVK/Ycf46/Vps4 family AAA+-type ATPase